MKKTTLSILIRGKYLSSSFVGLCLVLLFAICTAHSSQTQSPFPVIQSGHRPGVIAVIADGHLAVTGGEDGLLKWWDRKTGLLIRTVAAHTGSIATVSFTTDGKLLLSGGVDGFIRVWDVQSGRPRNGFRATTGSVVSAAFNSPGDVIASCVFSTDLAGRMDRTSNDIQLWNASSGDRFKTLAGHAKPVILVDFGDADTLVSASDDKTVKVWSLATGQATTTIQAHVIDNFLDVSPDGKLVAMVTYYSKPRHQELTFFDALSGRKLRAFDDTDSWHSTAISANWRYFAVTTPKAFKIWDVEDGSVVSLVSGKGELSQVAIDSRGKTIALARASSPFFWPATDDDNPQAQAPLLGITTGLAVSEDRRLVAWGNGNKVYLWDQSTASLVNILSGHTGPVNEVVFSHDGRRLASCSKDEVKLWSIPDGDWLGDLKAPKVQNVLAQGWNGSQSVSFSPDGNLLATGELRVTKLAEDKYEETLGIRLWNVSDLRFLKLFKVPTVPNVELDPDGEKDAPYWIRSLAFSPDNKTIASDNGSNRVLLLDITTAKLRSLKPHRREINSVAFSNDGKHLVSASFDKTLRIWDVARGRVIHELKGHEGRVSSARFSQDGQVIISGSWDRTVKLWDANSGTNIETLGSHDGRVTSVGVGVDGKTIFTTGLDGIVKISSLPGRNLVATLVAGVDRSWICVAPDGYYKGTDAEKYLAWRVGGGVYPASEYQSTYSKSNILLARLNSPAYFADKPDPSPLPVVAPKLPPSQPERGAAIRVQFPSGQTHSVLLYKHSYALVMGNTDYMTWRTLAGVRRDVIAVTSALKSQGFEVVSFNGKREPLFGQPVLNLTRDEFNQQLEWFINEYGQDPENRLLIYYAGHGYTARLADGRKMGYLVMKDAPRMPDVEDALRTALSPEQLTPFRRTSVNMDEMQTFAKNITARHALFVFDSCFAGTILFRDVVSRDGSVSIPRYISEKVLEPVREFLTSGNELQTVPDMSMFREAFVSGIEGAADASDRDHPKDGFVTASELYDYIVKAVGNYRDQPTPVFGRSMIPELAQGDFVFVYSASERNKD